MFLVDNGCVTVFCEKAVINIQKQDLSETWIYDSLMGLLAENKLAPAILYKLFCAKPLNISFKKIPRQKVSDKKKFPHILMSDFFCKIKLNIFYLFGNYLQCRIFQCQ